MARKNKKINLKLKDKDFDEALLPSTRRSQFKDILSHEYKTILLIGMWLLVFFVPFILLQSFSNIFVYTYIEQNNSTLAPEEMESFELLATIVRESALILCYMIFSIGVAGSLRIIRNLVYGEAIFFKEDFILGIKKYWKLCLLSSFIFGLIKGSTNVISYLVNNYSNYESLYILVGIAIGVFYLFIIPIIFFYASLSITYDLKFVQCLTISIKFALANFLIAIAFSAILFALTFIWYIGILLVVDIILVVLISFIAPLYILLWHLYVTSKFDKHINKEQFPMIYKKGLRKGE